MNTKDHDNSEREDEAQPRRVASGVFKPTERSLSIAQAMASALDQPFDRAQVQHDGQQLLSLYFQDIQSVAEDQFEAIDFEHGTSSQMQAFAALPRHDLKLVFVDEHFHFWAFGLSFLVYYKACFRIDEAETADLKALVSHHFDMLKTHAATHLTLREQMLPLQMGYPDILFPTNALTQAMTLFVICHEIAHHMHGHPGTPDDPDQELVADREAYALMLRVHEARDTLTHAQIDVKMLCAPALMIQYLRAGLLYHRGHDEPSRSHPSMFDRLASLEALGSSSWSPECRDVYDALSASLGELTAP